MRIILETIFGCPSKSGRIARGQQRTKASVGYLGTAFQWYLVEKQKHSKTKVYRPRISCSVGFWWSKILHMLNACPTSIDDWLNCDHEREYLFRKRDHEYSTISWITIYKKMKPVFIVRSEYVSLCQTLREIMSERTLH